MLGFGDGFESLFNFHHQLKVFTRVIQNLSAEDLMTNPQEFNQFLVFDWIDVGHFDISMEIL
jgi:hypothetical protein